MLAGSAAGKYFNFFNSSNCYIYIKNARNICICFYPYFMGVKTI
jgi:hypothetical protein